MVKNIFNIIIAVLVLAGIVWAGFYLYGIQSENNKLRREKNDLTQRFTNYLTESGERLSEYESDLGRMEQEGRDLRSELGREREIKARMESENRTFEQRLAESDRQQREDNKFFTDENNRLRAENKKRLEESRRLESILAEIFGDNWKSTGGDRIPGNSGDG